MAICPNCNQELSDAAAFCPQCGYQANSPAVSPPLAAGPQADTLQLGKYFRTGWELFKQYPGGFIGFLFIYILAAIVLNRIPSVGWLAISAFGPTLYMGNFIVCAKLMHRQQPQFSDFFCGFNFFLPLLLTGILTSALVGIGILLLIIPGIYLAVGYIFAKELVIDRRMDFWQAMELSRRTVQKHWFAFFGFFLLLGLLNLAGGLLLGLGLLITVPLTFGAVTAAYADIFGWQSDYSGKIPTLKQP